MSDIDRLSLHELDARIAEDICGWELDRKQLDARGRPMVIKDLPEFSSSVSRDSAMTLFFEMRYPGVSYHTEGTGPVRAIARTPKGHEYVAAGAAETEALCRVFLEVFEGEGPGLEPQQSKPEGGPRGMRVIANMLAKSFPTHPVSTVADVTAQLSTLKEDTNPAAVHAAALALVQHCGLTASVVRTLGDLDGASNPLAGQTAVQCHAMIAGAARDAKSALLAASKSPDKAIADAARQALANLDAQDDAS
ncbi:MAG: hypothetical protein KDC95_08625 [Planctomycetes bacterium]|nr:hypothetical protein [Planctomycetota bacterium]